MTTTPEPRVEAPTEPVAKSALVGDREIKPLKANLSKACYDLAAELPVMMRHWPKTTRMGLGRRLEENTYLLLESAVVITNPILDETLKRRRLQDMSSASDIVLVYLRLAKQLKNIDDSRYANLAEKVVQIGKQVGGLEKHLRTTAQRLASQNPAQRPATQHESQRPGQPV